MPIKCERKNDVFGVSSPCKKTAIDFEGWDGIWQSIQLFSIAMIWTCVAVLNFCIGCIVTVHTSLREQFHFSSFIFMCIMTGAASHR